MKNTSRCLWELSPSLILSVHISLLGPRRLCHQFKYIIISAKWQTLLGRGKAFSVYNSHNGGGEGKHNIPEIKRNSMLFPLLVNMGFTSG